MRGKLVLLFATTSGLLLCVGCGQETSKPATEAGSTCAVGTPGIKAPTATIPLPTILLAQSNFDESTDPKTGETKSTPSARLEIMRYDGQAWTSKTLKDPDSLVLHKAVIFKDPEKPDAPPSILTISGSKAALKLWQLTCCGEWAAKTIWQSCFGGQWDRLRDFEIGDLTGDGRIDFAIVTHDQGVVVVLVRDDQGWTPVEIDRTEKRTFVHEAELGDLDGDGQLEFYATPSNPNKFDGKPQPGEIVVYRHRKDGFIRELVEEFPLRHVKEILATDIDGPVLLASVEAELGDREDAPPDAKDTQLKLYRYQNGTYVGKVVCTLPDLLCRFLNAGDLDGDGKPEIVASTHKKGLWLARPGEGTWKTELIDADSGGFEHATTLADLDGDGLLEIYVAADEQKEIRRYRWIDGKFKRETLSHMQGRQINWGISAGKL